MRPDSTDCRMAVALALIWAKLVKAPGPLVLPALWQPDPVQEDWMIADTLVLNLLSTAEQSEGLGLGMGLLGVVALLLLSVDLEQATQTNAASKSRKDHFFMSCVLVPIGG